MNTLPSSSMPPSAAAQPAAHRMFVTCILLAALGAFPCTAHALDGCKVLLCLAAPSWRSIPQCVPPINEVLRNLSLGLPFPPCNMAGNGNSADNAWANAPGFCPPQYTLVTDGENQPIYSCSYDGAVSVTIDAALFTRTWWSLTGDSVTEFSPTAKAQLGSWDTRFDDDYAAWLAAQPPADPPPESGY